MAFEKPQLVMCIEPQTKVRFRYESEGGSHGGLTGKREGKEKVYPTVKLLGYNGKKPICVTVSLYTEDYEQHILELKGPKGSTQFLTEKLKEDNTATFANIKILNKKQEDIQRLLMDQRLKKLGKNVNKVARAEIIKKYSKEIKDRAKNILNSVRLCFEAFEEGKQSRLCEPLFSDVICNQKTASKGELRIHRMSKFAGSWKGGDEIILLCDKVQKENIKIEFYEIDARECIIWEKPAMFTSADVHYQVAITFRTPPYKQNVEKEVFVRLARGTDYSEPRRFTYTPDFNDQPSKKRKLYNCAESVNVASSPEQMMDISNSHESNSHCNDSTDSCDTSQDEEGLDVLPADFNIVEALSNAGVDPDELEDIWENYALPFDDILSQTTIDEPDDGIYSQSLLCFGERLNVDVGGVSKSMDAMNIDGGERILPNNKCNAKETLSEYGQFMLLKIKKNLTSILKKKDKFGNTLLHLSVLQNKDIRKLLKGNQLADVNIIDQHNFSQETALLVATKLNNVEAVKKLLEHKANPNLRNKECNNCYHIASKNDSLDIMLYLLTLRKHIPQFDAFNYEGLSPLHLAIKNKSEGSFELLKSYSANLSSREQMSGRSLLHYAVEFWPSFLTTLLNDDETSKLVNFQDFEGNSPLHLAVALENIEAVKELLISGADPFLKNFKHYSNNEENSEDIGQIPADLTTNPEILEALQKTSRRISVLDELLEELCVELDINENWKCLALYFVDEIFIDSLKCSSSPARALIDHIKKEDKEKFVEKLKNGLEMAGLEDELRIFKERNL